MDMFEKWWTIFKDKSEQERVNNYSSLCKEDRIRLRHSFLKDGWCELFCQNHINECLDIIKSKYSIDLYDLRIKVLNDDRVFLIKRKIWEEIEQMILEYDPLFNSDRLFGGLAIKPWGKRNQFVVITQRRKVDA